MDFVMRALVTLTATVLLMQQRRKSDWSELRSNWDPIESCFLLLQGLCRHCSLPGKSFLSQCLVNFLREAFPDLPGSDKFCHPTLSLYHIFICHSECFSLLQFIIYLWDYRIDTDLLHQTRSSGSNLFLLTTASQHLTQCLTQSGGSVNVFLS